MKPGLYKISTEGMSGEILSKLGEEGNTFSVGSSRNNIFITISDTCEQAKDIISCLPSSTIELIYQYEQRSQYPGII